MSRSNTIKTIKHVSKSEIKELAADIMLEVDDALITDIEDNFDVILNQMNKISKIDTTNVKAMYFPHDYTFTHLRSDDESEHLSQEDILANAPSTYDGYIKINKVV